MEYHYNPESANNSTSTPLEAGEYRCKVEDIKEISSNSSDAAGVELQWVTDTKRKFWTKHWTRNKDGKPIQNFALDGLVAPLIKSAQSFRLSQLVGLVYQVEIEQETYNDKVSHKIKRVIKYIGGAKAATSKPAPKPQPIESDDIPF